MQRIEKALQNEEFRKLLAEYAEELADPKNREVVEVAGSVSLILSVPPLSPPHPLSLSLSHAH